MKVSTWETASAVYIEVADDGVGFVVGTLSIQSEVGKGTVVTMLLPKQETS